MPHIPPQSLSSEAQQRLIQHACDVRQRAYAPYSHFLVGAALQINDGRIIVGANVENCSYGLTICAERAAVCAAVAAGVLPGQVVGVAVAASAPEGVVAPCGACRQVLAEFAPLHAPIIMHNLQHQTTQTTTLQDLLPLAFAPSHLALAANARASHTSVP